MNLSEDTFLNAREIELFTQRWLPAREMKAALFLIHGYAEHSGRYEHLAEQLTARGYGLFAMDLQGHGRSGGSRCDIDSYEMYLDDLSRYFGSVTGDYPHIPWFVLGHSMGGSLAVHLTYRHQNSLHGLILSAPALKIVSNIPKIIQDMVRYVTAVTPTVPVINMDVNAVSRDPDVVAAYKADPLVYHGRVRARMALQLVDSGKSALDLADELYVPVWAGHGLADRIADPDGTRSFLSHLAHPDKTGRYYPDCYHELLNEPEKDHIIEEIVGWLDQHMRVGELVHSEDHTGAFD